MMSDYVPLGTIVARRRQYQNSAINNLIHWTDNRGRLTAPSGSGKTFICGSFLLTRLGVGNVHLVVAPTIALVDQLMVEYRKIMGYHDAYLAYAFHSGGHEVEYINGLVATENSGTDPDKIIHEMNRALLNGWDLVIFSTYASFGKLENIPFKTVIFDESQYCVNSDVFNNINKITSEFMLFATATEIHTPLTDTGRGHNNTAMFGDVIYSVPVKILLDGEWILPPKLHIMHASKQHENMTVLDEIKNLSKHQIDINHEMSFNKILFAMNGTDDITTIVDNFARIKSDFPTFRIFCIISNDVYGASIDGIRVSRKDFLRELNKTEENALIFHYDILTEGIDIDAITGVVILRNMNQTKLIQTMGRAQRVWKQETDIKQSQRKKKYAYISVMLINGNDETQKRVHNIILQIRSGGYDLDYEETYCTDDPGFGVGDDTEGSFEPWDVQKKYHKPHKLLENIIHETEKDVIIDRVKTLTTLELIRMLK